MPKYKNNSAADVALGGARIAPGESLETLVVVPVLPTGLAKTSDLPSWNPILLCQSDTGGVDATALITVPLTVNNEPVEFYKIMLKVTAGSAEIEFNAAGVLPKLTLNLNEETFIINCSQRYVTQLLVTFKTADSVLETKILRS